MKTKILMIALLSTVSTGCSMMPSAVDSFQQQAATAVVESSERVICRDIPVGTWVRMYGSNPERRDAWQKLCTAARVTPVPDAPVGQ